jgi:5-methylcytosine-specific restriction endonuclease McrA
MAKKWSPKRALSHSAQRQRKRAKRYGVSPQLSVGEWLHIQAVYHGRCAYCGRKPDVLTQDHITPLSKGGAHDRFNVIPACVECNQKKGDGEMKPLIVVKIW